GGPRAVGARPTARDGASRLLGGPRRTRRRRWGRAGPLGGGEGCVPLLHLRQRRAQALLPSGEALGQVLDARQHVGQPLRRLGLGARGALRAALLAPPGARERERL